MTTQLLNELKYNQSDIDNLKDGDYVILYQGNVITVDTHDASEEGMQKAFEILKWLCSIFTAEKENFFDANGTPYQRLYGGGSVKNVYDAIASFESMPRLLLGIVEDDANTEGLALSFYNDVSYDIPRSPEMRQLVQSGILDNFSSIIINDEEYPVEELLDLANHRSGDGSMPKYVYHGTSDKNALSIVKKGLRPQKNGNFYPIVNDKCVFLTSLFDTAAAYAANALRKSGGGHIAVIEFDTSKLDPDKVVLDWDVANQYSSDIENSPYDNIQPPETNMYYKGSVLRNSDKNGDKSVRFGYQGVIMPNAIRAIYLRNEGGGYESYTIQEFIDEMTDVKKEMQEMLGHGLTESITEDVEENNIDLKQFEPKKELHPRFWVNDKLNSRVRLRLLDIADDFMKEVAVDWVKPEDIVFTGSLANYNWSKHSDIDLHIMVDYKKVFKKTEFVEDYFSAKKDLWADEHPNLKIYGFPVEVYVEDTHNDNPSSGVYSLEKNEWIVEPDDFQDAKINAGSVKRKAAEFMNKIDKISDKIEHAKGDGRVESLTKEMERLFKRMRNMRVDGLAKGGEMSSGNIIWKICRRMGYLDKLWKIVNRAYDRINSITEEKTYLLEWPDKDTRGWINIGIVKGYSCFMGGTDTYLMANPNAQMQPGEDEYRFKSDNTAFSPDPEGSTRESVVPDYYKQRLEIYPEYKDTFWGELFLGRKKDTDEDKAKHEKFMSELNQDGNDVILMHNSPVLIKDGVISGGHEKQHYSNNSDVGVYFWGTPFAGKDPSGGSQYTYYCKVPKESVYDFHINMDRLTLRQALSKYPYVALYWNGGPAIVVVTWKNTPIWKVQDNRNVERFKDVSPDQLKDFY